MTPWLSRHKIPAQQVTTTMPKDKQFHVYMLASAPNGTLYIGVTSDLVKRVWQHKEGLADGFSQQYGVKTLVWFEPQSSAEAAINREKQLKKWNRAWKIELIEEKNPLWEDLYGEITS
jgi:putative endonuclease